MHLFITKNIFISIGIIKIIKLKNPIRLSEAVNSTLLLSKTIDSKFVLSTPEKKAVINLNISL